MKSGKPSRNLREGEKPPKSSFELIGRTYEKRLHNDLDRRNKETYSKIQEIRQTEKNADKLSAFPKGDARTITAKLTGESEGTIDKMEAIVDSGDKKLKVHITKQT